MLFSITCAHCGTKTQKRRKPRFKTTYCSRQCFYDARRLPIINIACDYCGEKFNRRSDKIRDNNFCSPQCYKASGRVKVQCPHCKQWFEAWKSQVDSGKGKYCSKECYARTLGDPPIERACKNCGGTFTVRAYKVKNGEGIFCCRQCQWEYKRGPNAVNWRGGWKDYYGTEWEAASRATRKRADYKCEHCGKPQSKCSRALDVHHIIPVRNFKTPNDANFPNNLIALCVACHKKMEVKGYKELPLFRF